MDLLAVPWLKPKLGCQGVVGTCSLLSVQSPYGEGKGISGHSEVTHWLHLSV